MRQKKLEKSRYSREIAAICMLAPTIVLMLAFKYFPIISGFYISLFDIDIVHLPGKFCGLKNYMRAFSDTRFYQAVWHNVKFFLYGMVMGFWQPIILAILINETRRSRTAFRFLYFIPAIVPSIAMTILWKYFWQPDYGLANFFMQKMGFEPQLWLNNKHLVYFCMGFPGLVIYGGMIMVIYLAALQNIPSDLYEEAYLEGAGFIRRMLSVTFPGIKSTVMSMLILSVTGVFNNLDNVLMWTGGGPSGATETLLVYAYKQAINSMDYSYAITMATIAFVITFVITYVLQGKSDAEV